MATHLTLPSPLLSSKPFSLPITILGKIYALPRDILYQLHYILFSISGDIAFRVADKLGPSGHVTVCDINASMLEVGKKRSRTLGEKQHQMSWTVGDAQNLEFKDDSFDAYTIAFGIRNVVDINQALKEAFRVLKPGGRFMCLEFSHVENPVIEQLYSFYSFQCIPPMGKVLAGDWDSYQYLVESIRRFPPQQDFEEMIKNAGFSCVTYDNLSFGVAAIHSGFKL